MGHPSKNSPWNWSVYRWIEGESANALFLDELQLQLLASALVNELHMIETTGGPLPGSHNYYRGASPAVYDAPNTIG